MQNSKGNLGGYGWLDSQPNVLTKGCGNRIVIGGAFRLVQENDNGSVILDTGWVPNCITYNGVATLLGRWVMNDPENNTWGSPYLLAWGNAEYPVGSMGLGGSGADLSWDYYGTSGLQAEIPYNAGSGVRANFGVPSLTCAANITTNLRENPSRLVFAGSWPAGMVCPTTDVIEIREVGMFGALGPTQGMLYAAAVFSGVYVAGAQACAAYYSVSISQAPLA